jgi:predicted transcriptional regulator
LNTSYLLEENVKRRDKLSIMAEILEIAAKGTLKTQIMYKANLSFAQLSEYLSFMKKANLLEQFNGKGKDIYLATPKGKDFLVRHSELTSLLKEDENRRNDVRLPPERLLRKN